MACQGLQPIEGLIAGPEGRGRPTIRGFSQAPELRETEFNALSWYPLTYCLFAAFAMLMPPHFG